MAGADATVSSGGRDSSCMWQGCGCSAQTGCGTLVAGNLRCAARLLDKAVARGASAGWGCWGAGLGYLSVGVEGVLGRAEGVVSEFESRMSGMYADLGGAAGQSGSGLVAGALGGFGEVQAGGIGFVFARAGAAVSGAARATRAYVEGDLQMAANAQAAASAAPDPRGSMPGGGVR